MFERPTAGLRVLVTVVMVLILGAGTSSMASQPPRSTRATEVIHLAAQTETHPHITWLTVTGAEGNLWLLGEYTCSSGTCLAIFESENGGESFVRVPVPPVHARFFITQGTMTPRGLPTGSLLFANREDGYAYSSDGPTGEDSFFWTGDGGTTWQRVQLGGALAAPVVVADGRAYAVTYECRSATCSSYDLVSSPVAENEWITTRNFLSVETKGEGQNVSLSAFGSSVWLVLTPQGGEQGGRLLVSRDYGRVWSALPSDQIGGAFSCSITATSVQTLWGTCYGLHSSATVRSTDGGRRFFGIAGSSPLPDISLFPLSDEKAVLLDSFTGSWNLEVTTDGGHSFKSVLANRELFAVGFATGTTWVVPGGPNNGALYRTTNAGRSWQSVKAPTVTATTTVSSADLSRFVALAHKGLREPFQATYRFVPPLGRWGGGHVYDFRVWSEPAVGSFPEGNFVYESPFGRGTFRFIQTGRGDDYECLEMAPRRTWRCVGPFGPQTVGQIMLVEGYRMPMWVMENLTTSVVGPVLSHRTVLRRRLWCLSIVNVQAEGVLCLTKTGQLAFDAKRFVGSSQLELVSLVLTASKSAFLLPAKPKPWTGAVLPNLCGKLQCPSPGML
jgi:photosystem II stability/assembly factor-like uncharacterized protein